VVREAWRGAVVAAVVEAEDDNHIKDLIFITHFVAAFYSRL